MLSPAARCSLLVAGLALPLAACGGSITFGEDLTAADAGPGPGADATTPTGDAGRPDSGVGPGPSDGGAGPGDSGSADGGGCRQRTRPSFPSSWPYSPTKSAYQTNFWGALPNREGCSLLGCHGFGPNQNAPLIPSSDGELNEPTALANAISQLWSSAVPTNQQGAPAPVPALTWKHSETGGMVQPYFLTNQQMFLESFVARSADCAWLPVYQREADAGPACDDAGVCDCPISRSTIEHCL